MATIYILLLATHRILQLAYRGSIHKETIQEADFKNRRTSHNVII